MTKVLDAGYVRLYDHMGNDLRIVNAARQSFGQESEEMGAKEEGILRFLMKNRHGTPFEHVVFQFNVKCPIFVAREWFRHRIGSFNEYSGRYTKMIPEYYLPAEDAVRSQVGKPGSYTFETLPPEEARITRHIMDDNNQRSWHWYESLLRMNVAKEVARMVLPVNMYTMFTWTVNLRALFNFVSLRSHPTAMFEIRQYSLAIEDLVNTTVPIAWEAFNKNGRVSP